MADNTWLNGKASFAYVPNAALGINLSRQKNAPLDVSSEFKSIKDMLYYVTEGRYPVNGAGVSNDIKNMTLYPYLGQIIALVNTDASVESVSLYYIKTAESLNFSNNLTDSDIFNHYFGAIGTGTSSTNPIDSLVKYDTYQNWNTKNPVLADGEIVLAIIKSDGTLPDRIIFKIGDGINSFTQLDSVAISGSNTNEQSLTFNASSTTTSNFVIPLGATIKRFEVIFTSNTTIQSVNNWQAVLISLKNNGTTVKSLIKMEDIDFDTIKNSNLLPEIFIYDVNYTTNASVNVLIDMTSLTGITGKFNISYTI